MSLSSRFFLLLLLFVSVLLPRGVAAEDVVIGDTCTNLGTSMMTSNRQNIAVCLEDTSGNKIWKGMTSSSSSVSEGVWCGFGTYQIKTSVRSSGSGNSYSYFIPGSASTAAKCEDVTIISSSSNGWNVVKSCPTDFSMHCSSSRSSDSDYYTTFYVCTCIK